MTARSEAYLTHSGLFEVAADCQEWSNAGECSSNRYMHPPKWSVSPLCPLSGNPMITALTYPYPEPITREWMHDNCAESCGLCPALPAEQVPEAELAQGGADLLSFSQTSAIVNGKLEVSLCLHHYVRVTARARARFVIVFRARVVGPDQAPFLF